MTTTITTRAEALLEGITEWEVMPNPDGTCCINASNGNGKMPWTVLAVSGDNDASSTVAFIAAAPSLVRELAGEVKNKERQCDQYRGILNGRDKWISSCSRAVLDLCPSDYDKIMARVDAEVNQ